MLDATDTETVSTGTAVDRVDVRIAEVQVVAIRARNRTTPVKAVSTRVVERTGGMVTVARSRIKSNRFAIYKMALFPLTRL